MLYELFDFSNNQSLLFKFLFNLLPRTIHFLFIIDWIFTVDRALYNDLVEDVMDCRPPVGFVLDQEAFFRLSGYPFDVSWWSIGRVHLGWNPYCTGILSRETARLPRLFIFIYECGKATFIFTI